MIRFNRSEFAAGWSALAGAMLGLATSPSVMMFYTFGTFFKELQSAFGWTRAETSVGFLVYQLTLAATMPFIGGVIDKFGVRRPVALSILAAGVGFVLLGTVLNSLWTFIVLLGFTALVSAASSPVAYTRVVNSWFRESRGLALGLALTGTGIAAGLVPTVATAAIARYGWRGGYLALAALILVVMPLILWLLRKASKPPVASTTASVTPVTGPTLREAVRGRLFWQLALACALHALAIAGLIVHFSPLLTDSGISKESAAHIAGFLGISIIAGRVLIGGLFDYFFAPRVVAVALVLTTLGWLMLATNAPFAPYIAAIAIGLSVSTEVDVLSYLTARYFGLKSYGRIYGCIYASMLACSAASSYLMGVAFDRFGNYEIALLVSAGMMAVVILLLLFLPPFERVAAQHRGAT